MENSRSSAGASPTARTPAEVSYRKQLVALVESEVPFLVGGAYAMEVHLGISRATKDFDVFVLPEDMPRALGVLEAAGYRSQIIAPHWLSKVFSDDGVTDIIFNSGNGICAVDAEWFEHARPCEMFDLRLNLCAPEEALWQKAFIMERERYDGADVAHLLRGCGSTLDWNRLLRRFGEHWRVLLSHLVLFSYIFPRDSSSVPAWVLEELLDRIRQEAASRTAGPNWCRGTLLSARQYSIDVERWGYKDARLPPAGRVTAEQISQWEAWLGSEASQPAEGS